MNSRHSFLLASLLILSLSVSDSCARAQTQSVVPDADGVSAETGSLDRAFIRVGLKIPAFAGLYYDERQILHVLLVRDASQRSADRNEVMAAIVQAGLLDPAAARTTEVVIEPAKTSYTWFDLVDYKGGMRDVLTLPDVTYLDADEAAGVITIGIANEAARARVQDFARQLGLPDDAWRTVISPFRERYQDLTGQLRPLIGGVQIKNDAGPFAWLGFAGICTMSLVAERSSIAGFITNSHCTRVQGGTEGTKFYQNGRIPFSLDYVAHESVDPPWTGSIAGCPTGFLCRSSDSAFAVVDIGNQNTALTLVAQPAAFCATASCPTAMSSSTARVTLTGIAPIPLMGAALTKVGRTTGWTGGFVTATCLNTTQLGTTFAVLCQTDFSGGSAVGDSGSPVFAVPPGPGLPNPASPLPTTGTLAGVLWGGTGPISTFSPIGAVASDLAPISLFPPPPSTTPSAPLSPCVKACRNGRDSCMRSVASPHGPRPQECLADYHLCLRECDLP